MGAVSFTETKTCLNCGKPLPRGWRDDVHRNCDHADDAQMPTTPPPEPKVANGNGRTGPLRSPGPNGLYDDIERLVREGKNKNAIATELHTSWETITKVCKERNLTPVRGVRGKSITIKAHRKPTESTPQTAVDKVHAIRERRKHGAEINDLASEFGIHPHTVELLCDGMEPAPDPPDGPMTDLTPAEKETAVPDITTRELESARSLEAEREAAYKEKFGELALVALTGEMPELDLLRLAYEYGYAVGGYRVLRAVAEE
jgi:hypothetical protein